MLYCNKSPTHPSAEGWSRRYFQILGGDCLRSVARSRTGGMWLVVLIDRLATDRPTDVL